MYLIVLDVDVKLVRHAKKSILDIGGGKNIMKTGNCMICNQIVYILNCHYQCNNCGYAMNWEEGQEVGQDDHKERENINVKVKEIPKKEFTNKEGIKQLL